MTSARLSQLRQSVEHLRHVLLPAAFDPTGIYADDDQDALRIKTLSFRVLAHAEIEAFLEDRAIEIAKAAWRSWKDSKTVGKPLLYLLAFSEEKLALPPATLKAQDANGVKRWHQLIEIDDRLKKAVNSYIHRISNKNHGIKEDNLLSILLPIGYPPEKCSDLVFSEFTDFGVSRGEAAHTSMAGKVTKAVNPAEEYKRVQELVSHLDEIDAGLDTLLGEAGAVVAA